MIQRHLQAVAKMVAFGIVFNGQKSYFRSPWNIVDFVVVCSCILVLALSALSNAMWSITWIRALRAVRSVPKGVHALIPSH